MTIKVKLKYQHNHRKPSEQVRHYKPWYIYLPDPEDTQEDKKAANIINKSIKI